MAFYNITISVDEKNPYQKNFLELLQLMRDTNNTLSIKPMKTKIFTSDCLFFDDVDTLTYKEISKVAEASSKLEMKIESVNMLDEYSDEVERIIRDKGQELIEAINSLMTSDKLPVSKSEVTVNIPEPPKEPDPKPDEDELDDEVTPPPINDTEEPDIANESDETDTDNITDEAVTEEEKNDSEAATPIESTEEYKPEDSETYIDDEIDLDDSAPSENTESKEPVIKASGKLYSDNYTYLMTEKEFQQKTEPEKQDLIHSEVGWHEMSDRPLERMKIWQDKEFKSYSIYKERYPLMDKIDSPKYWLISYTNYVFARGFFTELCKERECIYEFDSFIRAKLNRDIKSEPQIQAKIDSLYS